MKSMGTAWIKYSLKLNRRLCSYISDDKSNGELHFKEYPVDNNPDVTFQCYAMRFLLLIVKYKACLFASHQ